MSALTKSNDREGFQTVDSVDEARELLESLEHGETMLKTVVQGDGMLGGRCDEIRDSDHDGELQVQPPLIGRCFWSDIDNLAEDLYEKQLEYKLVDWEDRI